LILPAYDENKKVLGFSCRAFGKEDPKYIQIRLDKTSEYVYGLDNIDRTKPIIVVEGQIDSLFLDNCVASGDANLTVVAKSINAPKKILIFDNENRNLQIVKMMQDAIKSQHDVVIWPQTLSGSKDINEIFLSGITLDEIENIISRSTFSGLEAQTNFVFWKKI
jgi:hypothetical protein